MAITEVFIGSDHGGVGLRDLLARHLEEGGLVVRARFGPETAAESVDYPDVAQELCGAVLTHEGAMGLLVCGTGQGMAISANKVVGIRAGVASDPFSARMLRAHNDANVLCLGERVLGTELAKVVLDAFVTTEFEGGRHARRVAKIGAEGAGS
ncbi:MAG: ribose 5-phosphate isomerase B [Nannocystaceae bacterium]